MFVFFTSRPVLSLAAMAFLLLSGTGASANGAQQVRILRQNPTLIRQNPVPPPHPVLGSNQQHLAQWMDSHRNLSTVQQQRALEAEPGFRQLSPQTQQRMRDRLSQLNTMPPAQRMRVLERAEQMEQLNPQQRQQVRGAMAQLGSLPLDRRKAVARTFRQLRDLPPAERPGFMNSDAVQRQLSPNERGTLSDLLSVEPLLPAQRHASDNLPGQQLPQAPQYTPPQ